MTGVASIAVEVQGAVAAITISNTEKFNALTIPMWRSLAQAARQLQSDDAVRVIVVQGDGDRAFCAGADLSKADYGLGEDAVRSEANRAGEEALETIQQSSKPVIAKIRGVCMGGGLGLASVCDLRICAADARFRMPAARLGLGYPFPGVQRYVALMGPQNTFDIFATGRAFDGTEALRMGLVSRVSPPAELDAQARSLAEVVSEQAPLSMRALKLAIRACDAVPDRQTLEQVQRAIDQCLSSRDLQEGMAAFKEKRKPRFEGA